MTYRLYDTAQGQFALCWDTCCQIIKSYHRASLQHRHSKEVTESQSQMLSPSTWGMPDLTYLSVDWDKVRQESVASTMSDAWRLGAVATFSGDGVDTLVRELKRLQMQTRQSNALFNASQRQASSKTLAAMERSVESFQSMVDGAKRVRDLSGSVLIGAATAASGGLAGAAIFGAGAGSALKGIAKFQDSGSYGSAAIEVTQNIAFSVFQTTKVVKLVVSVTADTSKALIEGRPIGTALAEGGVNVPAAVLGEGAKKLLGPLMDKVAVPVVTKVITSPPQILSKLPIEVGAKVLVDQTKKAAQATIRGAAQNLHAGAIASTRSSLADAISVDDDLLLKFAVIDMSKGIGHSWW